MPPGWPDRWRDRWQVPARSRFRPCDTPFELFDLVVQAADDSIALVVSRRNLVPQLLEVFAEPLRDVVFGDVQIGRDEPSGGVWNPGRQEDAAVAGHLPHRIETAVRCAPGRRKAPIINEPYGIERVLLQHRDRVSEMLQAAARPLCALEEDVIARIDAVPDE